MCFLAKVRLTLIMSGPPTLLPAHRINEDAGIAGRFVMHKTSAPSPCYHFTDCFTDFEVKLYDCLLCLPAEHRPQKIAVQVYAFCLFNIYSLNLCGFNFLLLDLGIYVSEGLKRGLWVDKSPGRNTTRTGNHMLAAIAFLHLIHIITCYFMLPVFFLFLHLKRF